jgi:mRNA-degrading endonuclease RelE of RelBE toxin-antitoxin system
MGGPPPEIREKMEKLSEDQREKLFNKMRELREKSPDMSWEERGKVFNEALDKMVNKKK